MAYSSNKPEVCIIGLGYVGLPLAEAFAKSLNVIGFDIDSGRVKELIRRNGNHNMSFSDDPAAISKADFVIICVPTPLTEQKEPDLSYIQRAAVLIGQNMREGSVVVLESTVYPGVTEEVLIPILEKESGMECGRDFKVGYSPERINPGDQEHTIEKVTKVIAGMDTQTSEMLFHLYSQITPHVFKAANIRTAEAVKVVENIQRDVNISLMNELSQIFDKLGINTRDVLEGAATKWNFHRYAPGLIGGHCIPVVPYYLASKATKEGINPRLILAARAASESMPEHIAHIALKALETAGKKITGARILVIGLTYKKDIADAKETPIKEMINILKKNGAVLFGYDPLLQNIQEEFDITPVVDIESIEQIDEIILAVAHSVFDGISFKNLKSRMSWPPILIDIPDIINSKKMEKEGVIYYGI